MGNKKDNKKRLDVENASRRKCKNVIRFYYLISLCKRVRNSSASFMLRQSGGSKRMTLVPLTPVNTFLRKVVSGGVP